MGKKSILVVDDEPLIGSSLQEALRRWDYDATLVEDGQKALQCLTNDSYDMILTDIRMPNVTGLEILQKVRQDFPATAVIMITAYGTIDQAVDAVKQGAYDYITKPFSLDAIKLRIAKYFECEDLSEENRNLQKAIQAKYSLDNFIGQNQKVQEMIESLEIAFESDASVFVQSENGTG